MEAIWGWPKISAWIRMVRNQRQEKMRLTRDSITTREHKLPTLPRRIQGSHRTIPFTRCRRLLQPIWHNHNRTSPIHRQTIARVHKGKLGSRHLSRQDRITTIPRVWFKAQVTTSQCKARTVKEENLSPLTSTINLCSNCSRARRNPLVD